MKPMVNINTDMLTWAINRAGFDLSEFTLRVPNVQKWIDGEKDPTVKQLEDFSKKVYLPFGYLFLKEPPTENLPIPFFRTNNTKAIRVSVNVYDTILLIQQRQDWLREYLLDNGFTDLPFVGKFTYSNDVKGIVNDIRKTLNLSESWASTFRTWQEALNHLVTQIENVGIITSFNGVVGNNTSRKIPVEECRGFVLVDAIAPFMFINNDDSKSAQMFTLIHELAHVWTGHSAGFDFRQLQPADDPIEKICDKVAAEFLVPEDVFNQLWNENSDLRVLSKFFKVSEIVIARRALDTGKFSKEQFFTFYNGYIQRDFEKKMHQKSGGDFYATAKKRLSITFASHVFSAVKSGKLLYRDAYKLTGLKGDTFQSFFTKHL